LLLITYLILLSQFLAIIIPIQEILDRLFCSLSCFRNIDKILLEINIKFSSWIYRWLVNWSILGKFVLL